LTHVKIVDGWARSLFELLKLYVYDRTSGIYLMAINCVAAERGVLIKKEIKREFMGKT